MLQKFKLPLIGSVVLIAGIGAFLFFRTTITDLLNRRFPKFNYEDIQKLSLQNNQRALDNMTVPDLSLNISSQDLSFLVDSGLTQLSRLDSTGIPHVAAFSCDDIKTETSKQLIDLGMNFDVKLDTLDASLSGKFSGDIGFFVRNDSLILLPSFRTLHVTHLSYKSVRGSNDDAVVGFLNILLATLRDRINGYIYTKLKGIDIAVLNKEVFKNDTLNNGKLIVRLSSPAKLTIHNDIVACMVDDNGIHLLGQFNNGFGAPVPTPSSTFNKDFPKFRERYIERNKTTFPAMAKLDKTFFVISRKSVSGLLNNMLRWDTLAVSYIDTLAPTPVDKDLVIHSSDFDCARMDLGSCPQLGPPPPCPGIPCPRLPCFKVFGKQICPPQPFCPDPCRDAYYAALPGIGVQNQQAQVAYALFSTTAKTVCADVYNTISLSGGSMNFGNLHADASVQVNVTTRISAFQISDDLSSTLLDLNAVANLPTHVNCQVTTKPIGKLICPFDKKLDIPGLGTAAINSTAVKTKMHCNKPNDSTILVVLDVAPISIDATVSPTPLTYMNSALFTLFDCSPFTQTILQKVVRASIPVPIQIPFAKENKIERLIVEGKYSNDVRLDSIGLPITLKPIKVLDKSIRLKPVIEDAYFGFVNN